MKNWIRQNLFRSWSDGILSIVFGGLAVWLIWVLIKFVFIIGRWEIIQVNIKILLIGRFPLESLWLLNASVISIAFWMSSVFGNPAKASEKTVKLTKKATELLTRFGLIFGLGLLIVLLIGVQESISIATAIIAAIVLGRFLNGARWKLVFLARIPTVGWHLLLVFSARNFDLVNLKSCRVRTLGRIFN